MIGLLRSLLGVPELKTARLRLVAMTPAMLEADAARDGSLEGLIHAEVTAEWPPVEWETCVLATIFSHSAASPSSLGWRRYTLLPMENGRRRLIGCVGGFPKADGVVEIGYSTLPSFQRRGFGSEAASALVEWLLQQDGIRAVTAQAYCDKMESIKVMERCGMVYVGEGDEPGTVRYRRVR